MPTDVPCLYVHIFNAWHGKQNKILISEVVKEATFFLDLQLHKKTCSYKKNKKS